MFSFVPEEEKSLHPAERQRRVNARFPETVSKSPFHLWKPGDMVVTNGTRLLIGIATYDSVELKLLDKLAEIVGQKPQSLHVDVFNCLDCQQQEDFLQYFPGLTRVYQTPLAGIWIDGTFKEVKTGKFARDLIESAIASAAI